MKQWVIGLLLFSSLSFADTPPPSSVGILGGTDSTPIGNTGDSLKVTATFSPSGTQDVNVINSSIPVTGTFFQATQPVSISGTVPVSGSVTANIGTTGGLALNATLGSPFQAGGSIGNTAFGISGTLPAFASTPTFNLGTLNGAATAANQTSIISALGSPFQAGGSIGNSSFGISGTLPAFASTPTFNLGTLNGAATNAAQVTAQSSLTSIDSKLTSPLAVKAPVNTTGSGSSAGATVSTVATLTAPANAIGFILMNLDTSTTNMRWAVGRTASTTLGQQLQPGRSSDFVPIGANVSIIAESGTVNYDIQWISQ